MKVKSEFVFTKQLILGDQDETGKSKKDRQGDNLLIAKYINVGYYLVAPLLMGVFFGFTIDNYFKTNGVVTLVGILLGTVATFYNLLKLTKE